MGEVRVRVIEAKDLVAADRNGKSDPYVTLEIQEDPSQRPLKTTVHRKVSFSSAFISVLRLPFAPSMTEFITLSHHVGH